MLESRGNQLLNQATLVFTTFIVSYVLCHCNIHTKFPPPANYGTNRPDAPVLPRYNTKYDTVDECKAACENKVVNCDAVNYSRYVEELEGMLAIIRAFCGTNADSCCDGWMHLCLCCVG